MLQSRFVTLFFSYTVLSSSLISSILLLTDTEIFSHVNGQELNSTIIKHELVELYDMKGLNPDQP